MQMLERKPVQRKHLHHQIRSIMHRAPLQRAGTKNHGTIAIGKTSIIAPNGTTNHGNNKNTVRGNDPSGKKTYQICNISEANLHNTITGSDFRSQVIAGSDSSPLYQQILQRAISTNTTCLSTDAPFFFHFRSRVQQHKDLDRDSLTAVSTGGVNILPVRAPS